MKELFSKLKDKINTILADKRSRRSAIIWASCIALTLATVIGCAIYVGDYYAADRAAIDNAVSGYNGVNVYSLSSTVTVYEPVSGSGRGFIFYPGGKVEHTAYEPLMYALADKGITAVLCEMPLRLAVLDVNAADGIAEALPEVEHWFIGGHSLGGSMAASYLASHRDEIDGIVLLGSYSTDDITYCPTLSIYGSEDGVMNREKYAQYRTNLPEDMTEHIIDGGNHAYFGMYGEQAGDGDADITPIEQTVITADLIAEFITGEV